MKSTRAGVIGWPIKHSISPAMHNAAYKALGMDDWTYDANEIPPDVLRPSIKQFMMHGYIGLNVTLPFKQEVVKVTRADDIAKRVGAANTLILPRNACTNTDVAGFINDLEAHGLTLRGMRVILLGAGGAARAALYGLHQAGASVTVVNRTPATAHQMLTSMELPGAVLSLEQAATAGADLIVNATSVGLHPNVHESAWAADVPMPSGAVLYDMVYRPRVTAIMQQAESQGLRTIGGLGMLVRQGAAAFEIWAERDAPIDVMTAAAEAALGV
ncbi:MAG: shikimate dehydrogenase [Phototrophicaceae bacterium]|jgi:shikimate dehydrogenase